MFQEALHGDSRVVGVRWGRGRREAGEGQGRGRGVDAVKACSVGLVVTWDTHAPEGWVPPPGARWCRP